MSPNAMGKLFGGTINPPSGRIVGAFPICKTLRIFYKNTSFRYLSEKPLILRFSTLRKKPKGVALRETLGFKLLGLFEITK